MRGLGEVIGSSILALAGVVFLLMVLVFQWNALRTAQSPSWTVFALQGLSAMAMLILGLWGIIRVLWNASASVERRGALVSRAREINPLHDVNPVDDDWPAVPVDLFWHVLPGEHLRFQLWPKQKPRWNLILSGVLAMVFVTVTSILTAMNWDSINLGSIDVLGMLLNLALIIASIWSFRLFVRQLLKITGIGPTRIEISEFPLREGETYEFVLIQTGRIRIRVIEVMLNCIEEATFRDGTDLRTETREVFGLRIFRKRGFELKPKNPLIEHSALTLPSAVMHSFQSLNNKVRWQLTVLCQARGWPDLCRTFPILVAPATSKGHNRDDER